MSKIPTIGLRAASLTLPAALAAVVGTAATDAAKHPSVGGHDTSLQHHVQ